MTKNYFQTINAISQYKSLSNLLIQCLWNHFLENNLDHCQGFLLNQVFMFMQSKLFRTFTTITSSSVNQCIAERKHLQVLNSNRYLLSNFHSSPSILHKNLWGLVKSCFYVRNLYVFYLQNPLCDHQSQHFTRVLLTFVRKEFCLFYIVRFEQLCKIDSDQNRDSGILNRGRILALY